MPRTETLGLYIADDTTFKEENLTVQAWREKLNGVGEGTEASPYSDYQIIDQAFKQVLASLNDIKVVLKIVNGEEETTNGE